MNKVEVGENFGTMPEKKKFQKREGPLHPSGRTYVSEEKDAKDREDQKSLTEKREARKKEDFLQAMEALKEFIVFPQETWLDKVRRALASWLLGAEVKNPYRFDGLAYRQACEKLWEEKLAGSGKDVSVNAPMNSHNCRFLAILHLPIEEGDDG